ncbi:MAG TPA: SRPBCC family protein [Gammaproteobacteria bacterium]|nr:SRPBCC family protein [Gammaproteobacteria bacterium]
MNKTLGLMRGLGLGAGLMYLLDPDKGRRRRALLRDKALYLWHKTAHTTGTMTRDLQQRTRGIIAEAQTLFKQPAQVDDSVLAERVRAKLGRIVSHPHAIGVSAREGRVTLSGPILADEIDTLLLWTRAVPGVRGVENQLEAHHEPGHISALQGGAPRANKDYASLAEQWSPGAQLIGGLGGGALLSYGVKRGGLLGVGASLLGLGLLLRGATNTDLRRLFGLAPGQPAHIHKTLRIAAPVETVYRFWTQYENFPRIMSHLQEVTDLGNGRSHWVAKGPGGVPVEWDAEITRQVPNELISWRSTTGAEIDHAGSVHFTPRADGGTTVSIDWSYQPPAGVLGQAAAALLGMDLRSALHEDLLRVKTLLETGATTGGDAALSARPTRGGNGAKQRGWTS